MPHNTDAIQKVLQAYYIVDIAKLAPAFHQRVQAEPQDHQALLDAGFNWEEEKRVYSDPRMGGILAFPNGVFVWMYNTFAKVLKNSEKLNIWIDGRCETFLGELMAAYGTSGDITFSGDGERPSYNPPKPQGDETDQLIAKLKKKAGNSNTLPSDTMIDLGLKAKKDGNEKLLAYLKTVKPMNENKLKKSQLDALIREIVRGIVKEGYNNQPNEFDLLAKKLWGKEWNFAKEKKGDAGLVMLYKTRWPGPPDSRLLWQTPTGEVKYLDPKTKKWMDTQLSEMSGTAAAAPVSTPNAFQKRKIQEGEEEEQIDETTTGDVAGYNVPGAFSRKGGSHKGVEGSAALGYTLTPQGKKEMGRRGDRLYNEGKE
jgi:hypothetical protein